jgi:two-component system, cell cycle sensor histidine kinase and response regulator CckA
MEKNILENLPVNILMLEDSPRDTEIITEFLKDAGFEMQIDHAMFEKDYVAFLKSKKYDLILSDFMLPGFDAFGALEKCKNICPETPLLCVSGSIGEDTAVALLRQGAIDYVLKDRLKRLPSAVKRALEMSREKKALHIAEDLLRESEARFRSLYDDAPVGFYRTTPKGEILLANKALIRMLGYKSFEELSKRNLSETGFDPSSARKEFMNRIEKDGEIKGFESKWICLNGDIINVLESAKTVCDSEGNILFYDGVVEDITEKKKSEKALLESEERYRTLAKISPVGIFRTDETGYTTYVNPKWCEISGFTYEQGIGNGWLDAVHPDDRNKTNQGWEDATSVHSSSFAEYRFLRRDGTIRWVMGQAVPELNAENKIVGYVGTITDITDRVTAELARAHAENELRLNEQRLSFAMEATSDGLWDVNLLTGEVYLSARFFIILGYEPNELSPEFDNLKRIIHPDDIDLVRTAFDRNNIKKKERFEIIHRMISKGNEWRWIANRFKVVSETEDGLPVRIIGAIADITEAKIAEGELKRKNRALQVISACNEYIIKIKDEKTLLQGICDKISEIGEYDFVWVGFAMENTEKSIMPVTMAGKENGYLDNIYISYGENEYGMGPSGQVIRSGKPVIIHDIHLEQNFIPWIGRALKSGFRSVIALPLIDDQNVFGVLNIYSIQLNAFDKNEFELLTELANDLAYGINTIRTKDKHDKLQEQLIQSQKMEAVGKLAGGIAHDFNNILTVILGNSELVLSQMNEENGTKKIIKRIISSTKKAAGLTHQLLAFSRKQMVQPRILDLNLIVTDAQKMFYRLIGEDINLMLNRDPELFKIQSDQGQIDQIIMNLVVNAKDAMPNGGILTIKTYNIFLNNENISEHPYGVRGEFVVLAISDTGTGMPTELIPKIFDPFFTTKEPGKGTGLGLSVVYGIVKQNNGWIEVESEVGKGTCFKIFFPGYNVSPDESEISESVIANYIGHGEKIFIIEDDPDIRNMVHSTLSNYGYMAMHSHNLKEGLKVFNENQGKFDLVFMDIVLPDGSGIEFYQQLQQLNPELKVLFTSGYADEKARWSIIQEKKYDFLQKPYEAIDLLKSIKKIITRSE